MRIFTSSYSVGWLPNMGGNSVQKSIHSRQEGVPKPAALIEDFQRIRDKFPKPLPLRPRYVSGVLRCARNAANVAVVNTVAWSGKRVE